MQVPASQKAASAGSSFGLRSTTTRRVARVAAALAAAAMVLGGCSMTGLERATNRVYTPAEGTNAREAAVDILGAVIVSGQPNSGTFIASFVNNSAMETASVDSLAGGAANADVTASDFDAVDIPARGIVDLSDNGGLPLTGDFVAGDFVEVRVGLGDGTEVTMKVPVVVDDGPWDGLDQSA
jgi:hypothetical protein